MFSDGSIGRWVRISACCPPHLSGSKGLAGGSHIMSSPHEHEQHPRHPIPGQPGPPLRLRGQHNPWLPGSAPAGQPLSCPPLFLGGGGPLCAALVARWAQEEGEGRHVAFY